VSLFRVALLSVLAVFSATAAVASMYWPVGESVRVGGYLLQREDRAVGAFEQDFPRLRVRGPHGELRVDAEGGLVSLKHGLIMDKRLMRDNVLKSKTFYLSPHFKDATGAPLVIVLGMAFASDPGSIRVVALPADGKPRLAFSNDTFEPSEIADLDGDGLYELIGRPSYSQSYSDCMKTYDPFAVYSVAGKTLRYSEDLSRRYNQQHYYGWAGPKASEKVAIILCGKHKGEVMDIRKARSLQMKP